jgi:ATP-binding cassette subfamily F protein 3
MVGRGKVEPFDGDLDDYQRYLLDESKRLREEARNKPAVSASEDGNTTAIEAPVVMASQPVPVAAPGLSSAEQRKLDAQRRQALAAHTRPLKKELESIEQRIPKLEAEKAELETRLSTAVPAADIAEAGRRLKALGDELEILEERWLQVSEALQEAQSA